MWTWRIDLRLFRMSRQQAKTFRDAARKAGGSHGLSCTVCGGYLRVGSIIGAVTTFSGKGGSRYHVDGGVQVHEKCATDEQRKAVRA